MKNIYEQIYTLGIVMVILFGLIVIVMILSGNAHSSIPVKAIFGDWSVYQSNSFFDISVAMVFISLILVTIGALGKNETLNKHTT